MKKVVFLVAVLGAVVAFSSCEKCSTCTSTDTLTGAAIEEEFCGTGESYDNQLEQYEKNGWSCKDK